MSAKPSISMRINTTEYQIMVRLLEEALAAMPPDYDETRFHMTRFRDKLFKLQFRMSFVRHRGKPTVVGDIATEVPNE